MVDYKGNEIKLGMKLFVISTYNIFSKLHSYDGKQVMEFPKDDWRIILDGEVIEHNGELFVEFKSELASVSKSLKMVIDSLTKNQLIAIEGISDLKNN